jgi:hypothetical protein
MTPLNLGKTENKSQNKSLQGTSGQRGFPEFSLAFKFTDSSKLSASNPACP